MTPCSTVTSRLRRAGGPSADRSRIGFSASQIVDGRPGARTANTTRFAPSRASRASIASAVVSLPCADVERGRRRGNQAVEAEVGKVLHEAVGRQHQQAGILRARQEHHRVVGRRGARGAVDGRSSGASPSIVS